MCAKVDLAGDYGIMKLYAVFLSITGKIERLNKYKNVYIFIFITKM